MGGVPTAGGDGAHDVRTDDGGKLDLHRNPGNPPGTYETFGACARRSRRKLSGKLVVTGGLGQLGSVYAAGLAERGMRVAVFDVATGEVPEGVRAFEVDVTDRASLEKLRDEVLRAFGHVDVMLNARPRPEDRRQGAHDGRRQRRLRQGTGLTLDLTARGMGLRSNRYSMLVVDGVVKTLNVEAPGKFEVSDAETLLAQAKAQRP
ncbi:MAG: SDR family NAD(P)-dependent oxidoreductase [Aquincola sp.]|nr:SDR family NAD(P)-dependent oxidoreductase [Aquincola sp.]